MCGRYSDRYSWRELHELYSLTLGLKDDGVQWEGKYNIAPTTMVPVIRKDQEHRRADLMRWGLVPAWSKEIGKFATHNARVDTVAEKPTFSAAWKAQRRCLIPASSFFEWRQSDKKPFAIGLANKGPMAFGGIWEEWKPKEGPSLLSCTILTTTPNSVMEPIHNRMPVIIGEENWSTWLDNTLADQAQIEPMLQPFLSERMSAWAVAKDVGNVRNQGAYLVDEIKN